MARKLTIRGFHRKVQKELLARETLIEKFFVSLEAGLEKGDAKARDLAAQILGLAKVGGGININQQVLNAGRPVADVDLGRRPRSLESIVSAIEAEDRQRALPAPASSQVIDVTPRAD